MASDSPKTTWVSGLPRGEPDKDSLARLVDGEPSSAEVEYYEDAADPTAVGIERDQRRYRGMFRRRLRHRQGGRNTK